MSMPFISDQIFVIALNVMKVPAYKTILYYIRESGVSDLFGFFFTRDTSGFVLCVTYHNKAFFFFFPY